MRGEALSRLIWLLTKEEDAFNKLPQIATLHNCASDRICLVEKPVDVFHNIPEELFYQVYSNSYTSIFAHPKMPLACLKHPCCSFRKVAWFRCSKLLSPVIWNPECYYQLSLS